MKKPLNKTSEAVGATTETDVIFYYHEANDDLFAFFPSDNYDSNGLMKTSYSHIGQHSGCSPEYTTEARKATPKEYAELKAELIQIGYSLNILN
jgi:hypothetical protein